MPINSPNIFNVVGDAVVSGGGGGGAVDSVTGTSPISVSPTTGNVVVSLNTTGVVSHDTQPTLSADLDLNSNAIVANNNVNDAKLEFFGNNVILSSGTVGSIWDAYTAVNRFFINQPTGLGSPSSIASTDKLKIKSGNSTSAIKVDNASNTEVFNLEMDASGSAELNMPTGKVAVENLTLGASGTTYDFPNAVGDTGNVLTVGASGTALEFGTPTATKILVTAKNKSGGTLTKGTPVHAITPVSAGQIVEVIEARADTASAMPATLVLDEDLVNDAEGDAIVTGFIQGVDTSAFTAGDVLYVGSTGGYTNVKPTGTDLIQNLGVVVKSDASAGSGIVYGSGRSNDVPNIPQNYIWLGNASGVATPTDLSTVAVSSVTGTSPIVSSGGSTPNITHAVSGVTADTYKKATVTVDAKGHITSAVRGTDLITMRGETDTDWSARATWFVTPNWRSGTAKETGLTTVTLSSFDDWIRWPTVNFNEQFDGKIEVEGYLLMGPGVPATKANYRISVWSATATTNDTSETFTKVLESANLTAGNSNALTVIPKTTLTYTASAGDYLLIGLSNVSSTVALSTGMCYANLNVRFQNA